MKINFLLLTFAILVITLSSFGQETGTFTDSRDGKIYQTVKIGTQTWLAENLAFKADSGCAKKDNGYIYNWETANKVAPDGWHLPSKDEWEILYNWLRQNWFENNKGYVYISIKQIVYDNLKNNSCNFNAKFIPFNSSSSVATVKGEVFHCWTSTPYKKEKAWFFYSRFNTLDDTPFWGGPFAKGLQIDENYVRLIKN